MIPPPPVQGLGTSGGFKLIVQDRGGTRAPARCRRRPTSSSTQSQAGSRARRRVHDLPRHHAAALRRHRPRQGEEARRAARPTSSTRCRSTSARSTSTTSTSSAAPSRCGPRPRARFRAEPRDIEQLKTRNVDGRHGAARLRARRRMAERARSRRPLQHVSRRRGQRRRRARRAASGTAIAAMERLAAEVLPPGHRRSSGPTSPTRRSSPATPRSSSSRSACCSSSWSTPPSTRAGRCRSRSS